MKPISLVVGALAAISALLPIGVAGAGFTDTTTMVILSCDHGAAATATVTLNDGVPAGRSAGPFAVACDATSQSGTKRASTKIITSFTAAAVTIDGFTVSGAGTGACDGAGALTYRQTCPGRSATGATLTVR